MPVGTCLLIVNIVLLLSASWIDSTNPIEVRPPEPVERVQPAKEENRRMMEWTSRWDQVKLTFAMDPITWESILWIGISKCQIHTTRLNHFALLLAQWEEGW